MDKLPSYFVSVKEFRLPNCTYQFVVNISVGYDPIVLEQVEQLHIHVTTDVFTRYGDQSYPMPFNTVSALHFTVVSYFIGSVISEWLDTILFCVKWFYKITSTSMALI